MKVIITSTPEVDSTLISEVITILQNQKGELEFLGYNAITFEDITLRLNDYEQCNSIEEISRLSFDDFYSLCKDTRSKNKETITKNDFVVVLTSIDNQMRKDEADERNKDWFSAFSGNNIFIYVGNWNKLTFKSAQYAISFQVVENIFQSLINLDIKNWKQNPFIHKKPIGCLLFTEAWRGSFPGL